MDGEKSLKKKMANRLNDFLDDRFDEYRSQISVDISKGLSKLSGVIAIWTVLIISLLFTGVALALALSALINSFIAGFAIVAVLQLVIMYLVIKNRQNWIETPVFNISKKALRGRLTGNEENEKLLEDVVKKIEEERKEE